MNAAAWRKSGNPYKMLAFVCEWASERKLRLFACACCRRVWRQLKDRRSRKAVECAERHAEGKLDSKELQAARRAAAQVKGAKGNQNIAEDAAAMAAVETARPRAQLVEGESVYLAAQLTAEVAGLVAANRAWMPAWKQARQERLDREAATHRADGTASDAMYPAETAERQHQADLLRDLFGNPTSKRRRDLSWLANVNATANNLARTIAAKQSFESMPILADALEDAGCGDIEILTHLRGTSPHALGCWVLDLLLREQT
jgi:hypothetical protein